MRAMGMETAGTQTKVKICGLTRMEDVICVNQCRPDYAGFVFAKSRRQRSEEHTSELQSH